MHFSPPRAASTLSVVGLLLATTLAYPAASFAKRLSFQTPVQEKLSEGAGPGSKPAAAPKSTSVASGKTLAPLGLDGEQKPAENNGGFLQASASVSQVSATPSAAVTAANGKSESVVGKGLGSKVIKDAKKVDIMPIALMETDEESSKKAETMVDAEKRQISELWQSTIDRNPDIQFVITKLQPSSDANHAMASTMKMLSGALFGAMNLAPLAMGGGVGQAANPAAMMGMGAGSSLIQGLFADHNEKNAKKHMISQEQATILYKIVRDTADKLVASFRDYKKELVAMGRANTDLQDLQAMVAEARGAQDAAKQVEMEYTLRKARREIEKEMEDVRRYRQELADLAGSEAVAKLDKEMEDERIALENLTGHATAESTGSGQSGPFTVPPVQLARPAIASPPDAIPH